MPEWTYYFNFAAATGGIVTALLGFALATSASYVDHWDRRCFQLMFLLLLGYTAFNLVEQVSQYFLGSGFEWLSRTGVFFELLLSVSIVPLFTTYLLRCSGEDWRRSPLMRGALALWVVYVVVLVAAQFGQSFYYFSAELRCVIIGPLYPALVVPPALLMLLNLLALVRKWGKISRRQRVAFVICMTVPLLSVFLQSAFIGLNVLDVGTSVSAFSLFGLILLGQMDAYVRSRENAARRYAQIMALQMRPHFIYNVMTSIYYLCAQDPKRAQQVTFDFTSYLRKNFAVVSQGDVVAFSDELEYTRAYLRVEKARFEDNLVVSIDCPYTDFSLPPLTLQPLVENAVKHGADPELPPLHVSISTRKEAGSWVITVEDNGPGFDSSFVVEQTQQEGVDELADRFEAADWTTNPVTALINIRERLTACKQTLEIVPREGGGTVATIRGPLVPHDGDKQTSGAEPARKEKS